jgi:hypothetical protein
MEPNIPPDAGHPAAPDGRIPYNQNQGRQDFSFAQVANHLNVAPDTLRRLTRRFDQHLSDGIYAEEPHFSGADVAALVTVQQLLSQGFDDDTIHRHLTPPPEPSTTGNHSERVSASLSTVVEGERMPVGQSGLPKAINDVLDTLVNGQKAVLNSQSSVRDMLGVVAQDNFNLKEENRKLRERMLELERAQSEYQRRDEARRERLDNRIRALEATVGALQQQVAQVVQAIRRPRKRGWFG